MKFIVVLGVAVAAAGCAVDVVESHAQAIESSGHRIEALGAFSCDFDIDLSLMTESLGATIERDRIFLQRQTRDETLPASPGMFQKHIPFTPTGPASGFAGGVNSHAMITLQSRHSGLANSVRARNCVVPG